MTRKCTEEIYCRVHQPLMSKNHKYQVVNKNRIISFAPEFLKSYSKIIKHRFS